MKLKDLLATAPDGLIKGAGIESPDEVQLEQDFAGIAFMFLRDRAPALMPYLLGFEIVDREEDGSRAIGLFGFKISGEYYYVPAFFLNQQVKGMDLLFAKKTNSFMPLRESWINHILDRATLRLGDGNNSKDLRDDFERPSFDFISAPPGPTKLADAGVNSLFSRSELRKIGQMKSALPGASAYPQLQSPETSALRQSQQTQQATQFHQPVRRVTAPKQPGQQVNSDPEATIDVPAPGVPAAPTLQPGNIVPGNVMGQSPLFDNKEASEGARGVRDGTGPFAGSAQRSVSPAGLREQAGEPCPVTDSARAATRGFPELRWLDTDLTEDDRELLYRYIADQVAGGAGEFSDAEQRKLEGWIARLEPKEAEWYAGRGHEEWNNIQASVGDRMSGDAAFKEAWAGAVGALRGDTLYEWKWDKQAGDSPLLSYIANYGGPRASRALMGALSNVKFANAALTFYPDVKSLYVHEFDARLQPEKQASKVTVVSTGDVDKTPLPEDTTDDERKRLLRDSFTILDRREAGAKSEVFDADYATQYSNPDESGTYELLLPTGGTVKAWVLQPASGQVFRGTVVVSAERRFYFTADATRVFVRGDELDTKSPYEAAVSLNEIKPNATYVLVNEAGDASAPFETQAIVVENDERTRIRISPDTYIRHKDTRNGAAHNVLNGDAPPRFLQLAGDDGGTLRRAGDNLIVPRGWKALKLTTRYEYAKNVEPAADPDGFDATGYGDAHTVYDAFEPGDPFDVEEAFGKLAIHRFTVEAEDAGNTFYARCADRTEGPWNLKQAMSNLVMRYGMSVEDAEGTLNDAADNRKSCKLLKLAQGVGVGMPSMPVPPPDGYDPHTGIPVDTSRAGTSQGAFLGMPAMEDSMVPNFATGGQMEQETGGEGEDIAQEIMQLAQQAAETGQKNVFDHSTIGGLAQLYDASSVIDQFMPSLVKTLDDLGRILFIFYWKNADFAERYGKEDLANMEDMIRGVFKSYGDLVLKLKQKTVGAEDSRDILAV